MAKEQFLEDKEKFEDSMKEEDLIEQIDAWERESETVYELLKGIWEENLEYYHGNQTELHEIKGRKDSKAVENRQFMAVETMIPIATSRLPDIEVYPGDTDDEVAQMTATDLQDILNYQNERTGLQADAERFLRDMLLKRYGVWKKVWDKESDDVARIVIDPRRIRVPRFGRSVDELAFLIEDVEMSYNKIKSEFGEAIAEKVRAEKVEHSEFKYRLATFTVKEVWTNEFVVRRAGSIIISKERNPLYDFDNKDKNHFLHAKKPYIIKSLFETEESIIGDTDYIQVTKNIQDNINKRKRQIEDVVSKTANPILMIDSNAMSEEQVANITNEAGFIFYGDGAADGTKIRFENPGALPNDVFLDLEGSRSAFDNIWGIHSTTRGERQGKETLGGRQLLRQADLGRIDAVARQLERAVDEDAEWNVQLMKMFYNEKRVFTILGEDGVRFIKDFTGEKIGKIRMRVTPGSTLPKDEITQRQEAIELWTQKALGVRTLYKRLKMSNLNDAVQDYIETQSGQIFGGQQGGGGAEITPTTPPPVGQI